MTKTSTIESSADFSADECCDDRYKLLYERDEARAEAAKLRALVASALIASGLDHKIAIAQAADCNETIGMLRAMFGSN